MSFRAATAAGLALLTFLIYLPTVASTVTVWNGGGDSGELVRAAWLLGVPHPTGYPLWVLLAHAFMWFPAGEPAHRAALLSAVAAAAAVAFVFLAAEELLRHTGMTKSHPLSILGPLAGAMVLAASPLFWQQATIPETYALDSCLEAAGLWLLLRWLRGAGPIGLVTVALGLALSNHMASLGFALAVGAAVLRERPDAAGLLTGDVAQAIPRLRAPAAGMSPLIVDAEIVAAPSLVGAAPAAYVPESVARRGRRWAGQLLSLAPALLLPLLAYGWLLLRARSAPLADWGDPSTLPAMWQHVTAGEYHHFLASRGPRDLLLELARWPGRLREQYSAFGTVAAVWSLGMVLARSRRAGLPLLVALLANLALVVRDAAPTAPTYLHVSYLVLAIALGAGLALIPAALAPDERTGRRAGVIAACAALLLAGWLGWHTRSAVDLSSDVALERQAEAALAAVPPGGVLLTEGDNPLFALWYDQDVLGQRPDVLVWSLNLALDPWYAPQMHRRAPDRVPADLPPDEATAAARLLAANLPSRAVVSVEAYPELAGYEVAPDGAFWRVVGPKG